MMQKLLRPRRSRPLLVLLAALWLAPAALVAQSVDDEVLQRRLEQIERNPLIRELLRQRRDYLNPQQKRLLEKAIDQMSDAELSAALTELGLSTEGSDPARRDRLKVALAVTAAPELPQRAERARIAIENASEGEFLSGEDDQRGVLKLYGRIRVRLPNGVFTADRVIVDRQRQEIYGEGDVVYTEPGAEIRAERILYNLELQNGIVYNAAGYSDPLYFVGRNLQQIGENRYALSHAFFTTCAAEKPHYNFTAHRLWIYDNNKIFAVGALYYIGGVPLLPLPFLFASDWGTGIIAQAGYSQVQGWYLQNTYQFGVPDAVYSAWQPQAYRFKYDYYQNTGSAGGVELYKFSPSLSYIIDVGAADYRRYGIAGDVRDSDQVRITNQVQRCVGTPGQAGYYCTTGEVNERWYKIFTLLSYRNQSFQDNVVRNLFLRYEDYNNQLYEYEFGGRFQPTSTIPALYENGESARGLIRASTNWNIVYSEQRNDLNIRVAATRNNIWRSTTDPIEGQYLPVTDVAPTIDISKRINLGELPLLESAVYWDHALHTDLTKQYTTTTRADGSFKSLEFKNLNNNSYRTGFRTFVSFFPWITIQPGVGYGIQKTVTEAKNTSAADEQSLEQEAARNSYQFWYTEDRLTIGPDLLFFSATYRYKRSFKEDALDAPTVNLTGFTGRQKVHETEARLEFNPFTNFTVSASSVYDHRRLPYDVSAGERWSYPVLRADLYLDFINWFREDRENLLSRNRVHFLGLRLINDYVYDPQLRRDHSNVFGATLEMGGFDLWLLERLRYFEMSYYWYHVYYDPTLDHMRFGLKTDLQLWSWGYLELELESRAVDAGRYDNDSRNRAGTSNAVDFSSDVLESSGLAGAERRQQAVFNTSFFRSALILDLDDWEYRLGYEIEQRTIFGGQTSVEVANFYDNRVFFSLTLLRYDLGASGSQPSRFLLNRQRVQPGDIGRQPISSGF